MSMKTAFLQPNYKLIFLILILKIVNDDEDDEDHELPMLSRCLLSRILTTFYSSTYWFSLAPPF